MGIGVAIAVTGAVISAYGAYEGSKAAEREARFNAEQARIQAELARKRAQSVRAQGAIDASLFETSAEKFIADQLVSYVGSNVAVESGVVSQIVEDTARTAASDTQTIQRNAKNKAWGIETGALALETQAGALEREAGEISRLRPIATAGNILTIGAMTQFGLKRTQNPPVTQQTT